MGGCRPECSSPMRPRGVGLLGLRVSGLTLAPPGVLIFGSLGPEVRLSAWAEAAKVLRRN